MKAPFAYYNEIDKGAAQWLRELIKEGHIANGEVDERSIEDVVPTELMGYTQCHFFAGIGVWSYALRNAGWDDSRRVWTGSCPCQPFSSAGKGKGVADERHLWPAWLHLIGECRPEGLFGEQVGKAAGRAWLDIVQNDLEAANYAAWAICFNACSVGAPHIRQRLYWMAVALGDGLEGCAIEDLSGARGRTEGREVGCFDSSPIWITGNDGKARPIKSGIEPLVDGFAGRVELLRGYGNGLCSAAAEAFIQACM